MKARDEREKLEELLQNAPSDITKNVAVPGENLPEIEIVPLIDIDFDELKKKCEREARSMVKNSISFMIPMDMIRKNKYLKDKFRVDVMSLAGMIYQLRSNEVVQKALMEQISSGLAHPRMFEVFAGMSKTIGDLNKQLLQTCEALKETYRSFKQDVKEQRTEALGPSMNSSGMLTSGDGSIVTRGTKELINRVKQVKNQKDGNGEYLDEEKLIPSIHINREQ